MAASNQRFGCYVGNIDASVPLETIRQVFAQCGSILDCSLNGRDTDPYRFGFIDFGCEADRERALKFNGVVLAGRPLKVGVSKGNVNRPTDHAQGGGGGGGRHHNDAGIAESTALLVQLVQSGAVNPANLTPEQQRLLSGALLGQLAGGTGLMQQQQQPPPPMMQPMGMPPQNMMGGQMGGQMMGGMQQGGGYGGGMGYQQQHQGGGRGGGGFQAGGRGGGYRQGPPSANPAPSEELVMLRQAQRKTFFDVVRRDADKYQEKTHKKKSRRDGSGSDSDGSSSSGGEDRRSHRRERTKERREEPRREESKGRRDGSAPVHDDSRNAL